jgi:hypothetical protein
MVELNRAITVPAGALLFVPSATLAEDVFDPSMRAICATNSTLIRVVVQNNGKPSGVY